jgi:hypothetical protein
MTDLRRARTDLRTFSLAIQQPLESWQADSLALKTRTTVIVAPRQSGKSRSLAVLALWQAYGRPDQHTLVVSAGESASRRLLAEAASVAVRSPLLNGSIVDENSGLLSLSNGSTIRSVPASERVIRGWTVDLLVLDEAAQVEDDLILSAALPTTAARPDAKIVFASSPGPPEGVFYDFAVSPSENVHVAHWALEDATWIAPEVIEQAREQLPPSAFAREYLGQFTDAGDETIIPREWILAAQHRELEPPERVVFGVDLARGGDESVCVRLDGGRARVAWANRDPDLMRVADRIAATVRAEAGPEPPCMLDVTGLGFGPYDRLRELGVNVAPFYAAGRAPDPSRHLNLRAAAWFATREAFRLGEIDLDPADTVIASQLAAQKFTIASSGALQVASKTGQRGSPDRADALVLAVYAQSQHVDAEALARNIEQMMSEAAARPTLSIEAELSGGPSTEQLFGTPRRREKIVPDSVYRDSAGGRHESW